MSFAEDALTEDALLGGRVRLRQPAKGYRAATDPVLLAAAVGARTGETVLDAGCGAGAAALCLAARVPGLALHGLELQADYAALARINAPQLTVWEGDLLAPPAVLRSIAFDWVISNPPYFDAADAGHAYHTFRFHILSLAVAIRCHASTPRMRVSMARWSTCCAATN